ncbi:PLP-dependent aminotransferase family protein [Rugamonas sp.]|uniref:MocR-like pyridoxine biosynthesis transcription factor PdxR n=1 Tax=Rugamonas sp. TaxID=1926287 RepID=UPI0025DEF594|nr:PLP-dependent aminotransferase family protein [Rugamonas sp.]
MELHILIKDGKDLAHQIYDQISHAIDSGRLANGQQVPPSRLLAKQLGVARKSVADAYNRLSYDKKLVGYVGKGTFVHHPFCKPSVPQYPTWQPSPTLQKWIDLEVIDQVGKKERCVVDFTGGESSTSHFPQDEWRSCVMHGLRRSSAKRGRYGDAAGIVELRQALLRHAGFSRGVTGSADDVIVTNGAQQALDLICRVLVEPGMCVAVEDPGYPRARLLFASLGARVVGVPVDADGIDVDAIPNDAKMIYVTPAHQFPLGMPMSEQKRHALLNKAAAIGAIIVEDDYDSEFRYSGRPIDSLQSLDSFGVVIFVGTMSKVMFPEMRIGYVLAPPIIAQALISAKRLTDWQCNTMLQFALAKFVSDGHLLRHVRRVQNIYALRREKIQKTFDTALAPWFELIPSEAGFHMAAPCKQKIDIAGLIAAARKTGVGLYPLSVFYAGPTVKDGLFLGYGSVNTESIEPALLTVRDLLRSNSFQGP